MNPRIFALGLATAALIAPSSALADSKGLSAAQSATNNQHNSGSVVLNPSGGTQVNNNVNNAYSSTYSFGPGISCPTPSLAFSAFGGGSEASSSGYTSDGASYGGSVSFIMPIGGDVGDACSKLAEEITLQRQLDTKVNLIKVCANLAQSGITVDVKTFPEFEVCSAVTAGGKTAVTTAPVFSQPSTAIPVIPVR